MKMAEEKNFKESPSSEISDDEICVAERNLESEKCSQDSDQEFQSESFNSLSIVYGYPDKNCKQPTLSNPSEVCDSTEESNHKTDETKSIELYNFPDQRRDDCFTQVEEDSLSEYYSASSEYEKDDEDSQMILKTTNVETICTKYPEILIDSISSGNMAEADDNLESFRGVIAKPNTSEDYTTTDIGNKSTLNSAELMWLTANEDKGTQNQPSASEDYSSTGNSSTSTLNKPVLTGLTTDKEIQDHSGSAKEEYTSVECKDNYQISNPIPTTSVVDQEWNKPGLSTDIGVRKIRSDVTRNKKRKCNVCKKKLDLTAITCRCGGLFCAKHRYDREHNCTFDYKSVGADKIRKENPKIIAEKVKKL